MASLTAVAMGLLLLLTVVWLLGSRLLVLAASFVLARLGIKFSLKELRWCHLHGLVLQLKKGPISRLEVHELQLQLLPGGLLSILQGNAPLRVHLQLDGLHAWLPGKRGSSSSSKKKSRASSKAAHLPEDSAQPKAPRKKGKKNSQAAYLDPQVPATVFFWLVRCAHHA
mmetsp:Transcript_16244/g.44459  ORF Transcript_16244/g.44459 Transcript_16244/m.44459 type:complete len:169 (-) Transcript_16244:321-827(-)